MKKIEAIIGGDKIRRVCDALLSGNATDITVIDCGSTGATLHYVRSFRTENLSPELLPSFRIEVVVPSDHVDVVLDAFCRVGGIEEDCADRLRISSIDTAIRIRNSDRGDDALG